MSVCLICQGEGSRALSRIHQVQWRENQPDYLLCCARVDAGSCNGSKQEQTRPHVCITPMFLIYNIKCNHNPLFKIEHLDQYSYSSTALVKACNVSCCKNLSGLVQYKFISRSCHSLVKVVRVALPHPFIRGPDCFLLYHKTGVIQQVGKEGETRGSQERLSETRHIASVHISLVRMSRGQEVQCRAVPGQKRKVVHLWALAFSAVKAPTSSIPCIYVVGLTVFNKCRR